MTELTIYIFVMAGKLKTGFIVVKPRPVRTRVFPQGGINFPIFRSMAFPAIDLQRSPVRVLRKEACGTPQA
jgi:hypothetical protein